MTNASLKTCKDCGKSVSKRARKCPNCGAPTMSTITKILLGMIVVISFTIAFVLISLDDNETNDNQTSEGVESLGSSNPSELSPDEFSETFVEQQNSESITSDSVTGNQYFTFEVIDVYYVDVNESDKYSPTDVYLVKVRITNNLNQIIEYRVNKWDILYGDSQRMIPSGRAVSGCHWDSDVYPSPKESYPGQSLIFNLCFETGTTEKTMNQFDSNHSIYTGLIHSWADYYQYKTSIQELWNVDLTGFGIKNARYECNDSCASGTEIIYE